MPELIPVEPATEECPAWRLEIAHPANPAGDWALKKVFFVLPF
jgi:hypothetical protein